MPLFVTFTALPHEWKANFTVSLEFKKSTEMLSVKTQLLGLVTELLVETFV